MNDSALFHQECLKVNNCAKQYFGAEDLPLHMEICIGTAINWIIGSEYPPLSILGRRILRTALSLPSYHEFVVVEILKRVNGCEPIYILELLAESPPSDNVLQKLSTRWPSIRTGLLNLITSQMSHPNKELVSRIQGVFKLWKRCLKALTIDKDHQAVQLHNLLKETIALLRGIIDISLTREIECSSAFILDDYYNRFLVQFIKLLQKVVEVVCYDSWNFAIKPRRIGMANDNLYDAVVALVVDLKLGSEASLSPGVNCSELSKFAQLLTYTKARVLYAVGSFHPAVMNDLSLPPEDIVRFYAEDDVLLFRMLITLLMIENDQLKSSGKRLYKIPAAHDLFASLIEWIGYSCHTIIDWLVSPETDCLAYLLAYTKRLGVAADHETGPEQKDLWSPSTEWLKEYGEKVKKLLTDIVHSLFTLHSSGSLPFSPELLIANISKAIAVLK